MSATALPPSNWCKGRSNQGGVSFRSTSPRLPPARKPDEPSPASTLPLDKWVRGRAQPTAAFRSNSPRLSHIPEKGYEGPGSTLPLDKWVRGRAQPTAAFRSNSPRLSHIKPSETP